MKPLTLIGRIIIRIHLIVLGPEYDLSPQEERWMEKWGYKRLP